MKKTIGLLLFVVVAFIAKAQPDGTLDTTFNPGTGASNSVYTTALQPDGKIIIGGSFTSYNGTARNRIARLNADGSLDTTFNSGTGASGSEVQTTALQPDGKIIIGGDFITYNGTARNYIARLNTDGSLDTTFNPGTGASSFVETTVLQPDGKIIIGGNFTSYNGTVIFRIARLNADGSLDATFTGTGTNGFVETTVLQPDGKIIIGGEFTSYNGTARNRIVRVNADGSLDATFNPGTGANNDVVTTALQPDGKIIIGGYFTSYNSTARYRIARLNADGSLDTTFNPGTGPSSYVWTTALQSDGKIIIGGLFSSYNGILRGRIARLKGGPDCSFSANPTFTTTKVNCTNANSGGAAITNVNGGSSPYSYLWSNGSTTATASGLAVGSYNVTVTDNNGCTFSTSVNITKFRCATLGPSPINVPFIQMPGAIIPR